MRDRILIVEDDRPHADALAVRLASAGYATTIARDAYEGTREARKERPDLVVMDVRMAVCDGFDVHELINQMYEAAIPVIYLTGCGREDLDHRARTLGARAVLRKPIEASVLLDAVAECLHGGKD